MPSLAAGEQQPALAYPRDISIELLVPASSKFDTQSYIEQAPDSYVKSRDTLFFEEVVPVEVLIHGSLDNQSFQELLSRTEVNIIANATSAAPPPRGNQGPGEAAVSDKPLKVLLDSVTLDSNSAIQVERSLNGKPHCYGVFKADLYLRYPTAKLYRPVVHFNVAASLKPTPIANITSDPDAEYLPSGLPEPENLLGSLVQSLNPATGGKDALNLPASRLIKVAPRAASINAEARPLRTSSKLIPILPILMVRVACSAAARMPAPVATLELELTKYVTCSVEIQNVEVRVTQVHAECLTESLQSSLILYPGDRSSLVYKLHQDGAQENAIQGDRVLEVDILATAQLTESCTPRLKILWKGSVNPYFGKRSNHWQRPGSSSSRLSLDISNSRPVSKHLSMTGRPLSMIGQDLGVTFAFSGPPSVYKGETFYLDIFIVNRSMRRKRLAIIAIPHPPRSSQSSTYGPRPFSADSAVSDWRHETADAIASSRSLFNQQLKRHSDTAEVVNLNADVRIGPLPPGTCHNVQLEFLALSVGFVGLSAVHIIDLESKETTEVTELPEIEVLETSDASERM